MKILILQASPRANGESGSSCQQTVIKHKVRVTAIRQTVYPDLMEKVRESH